MPDSNIKIKSLNCRGLASKNKRLDYFSIFKAENLDIILLQDVHWDEALVTKVKEEWGYLLTCAPLSTQSRGTAILFNNTFEFSLGDTRNQREGNYSIAEIHLPNKISLVIGSIDGPNSDTPEFYTELENTINLFENPSIIIGGDWNSTRDFNKDNLNYARINNPKLTEAISHMCTHFNLVDTWRIKNPTKKQYTWLQGLSNKQSRLDYFLITEELLSAISEDKIGTKYRSDHAPVYLTFTLSNHIRGPGTWKLNNSLLLDEEFIILIKKRNK